MKFRRRLIQLPTKAEVEARFETIEVFIADVPMRSANQVLKATDAAIHQSESTNLRHLKRFIKSEDLPPQLKHFERERVSQDSAIDLPFYHKAPEIASIHEVQDSEGSSQAASLHFLICPIYAISYESLREYLSLLPQLANGTSNPKLRTTAVPLFPPTSEDHAKQLSQQYWPTVYRGGNPLGPHPISVTHASKEILDQVGDFMCLAGRAGFETSTLCIGEAFGAVAVERTRGNSGNVIAAAGDARWEGIPEKSRQGSGNTMAHSVMRVIGMIARKRLVSADSQYPEDPAKVANHYADEPLTPMERASFATAIEASGGYLCLDLELYITHEPCLMCCMAINHSRFGKVVFGELMLTGGLSTENVQFDGTSLRSGAYGLWWRKDLNWKFLTWRWANDDKSQPSPWTQSLHA